MARQLSQKVRRATPTRADAGKRVVPPLCRRHGPFHLGIRHARGSGGRNAAARHPVGPAVPPQPVDGLAQQGQPQKQGRRPDAEHDWAARQPGAVHHVQPDRPGGRLEIRRRALSPAKAALLRDTGVAARRLLASAELERARLLRLRQGRLLLPATGVRSGAGLLQGVRGWCARAVGYQRYVGRHSRHGHRAPGDVRWPGGVGGDTRAPRAGGCQPRGVVLGGWRIARGRGPLRLGSFEQRIVRLEPPLFHRYQGPRPPASRARYAGCRRRPRPGASDAARAVGSLRLLRPPDQPV